MDRLSQKDRSRNMARIRSKNTRPEMAVRSLLHGMGYRYRLHADRLPGRPDIVFSSARKAIFVHGCFWHQHQRCAEGRVPNTRQQYWIPKLQKNCERDRSNRSQLAHMGWRSLIIWECELKDEAKVIQKLARFLGN